MKRLLVIVAAFATALVVAAGVGAAPFPGYKLEVLAIYAPPGTPLTHDVIAQRNADFAVMQFALGLVPRLDPDGGEVLNTFGPGTVDQRYGFGWKSTESFKVSEAQAWLMGRLTFELLNRHLMADGAKVQTFGVTWDFTTHEETGSGPLIFQRFWPRTTPPPQDVG
jgi:hypothetical protein